MKKEDIDENRKKVSSAQIPLRKKDTLAAALMIVILLFAVASVSAADYQVHEGESIQAAINMSNPGDTIIVHNGTYIENVVLNRSNILIRSANGSAVTIVQSNRTDMHVFNITDQENITLDGFTIRDASAVLNTTKNVTAASQTTVSILTVPTQPTVPEGPSIDGFLSVTSTPSGADITIDGRPIGEKTPHSMPLMPGSHTIKLTLAGYQDWTERVQVTGGSTINVHATLIPTPTITGFLSVTSSPSGADIIIDGRSIGEKTPHSVPIDPGPHTIKLTLAGYQDWTQSAQVKGGETTNVHATLSQATGSIKVTSSPSGAKIYVDTYLGWSSKGQTPNTITSVSPGDYTIKLTLAGYQDWTKEVQVKGGSTTNVHATLSQATGSVSVTSTPSGASISFDGVPISGITPYTIPNAEPGDHTIKLTLAGYQDWTETVSVTAGKTVKVSATLASISGSATITSTPSGAAIYVKSYLGDSYIGKTPHTDTAVPPGDYTIKLTLAGYQDWTKEVQVKGGETAYVHATLTPATGSISVSSAPSGADISLDGVPINEITPYAIPNVEPGDHTLKLTLEGYQDWKETVSVTAGKTVEIGATLTPISGSATVTSTPSGAAIYVETYSGDVYIGDTTYTDTAVAPGYYTITLTLAGYQNWTKEVQVKGGETTYVHATLDHATGSIRVTSTPAGAGISLDGVPINEITPYTIPNVDQGYHTIELTLEGYQDWTEAVNVTAGKTVEIDATLTPISGSATVTSTPSGAAIYVETYSGDVYIEETPHTDTAVSPGNYTIKLTLAGYQDWTEEIQVTSGETAYIDAILTPCPLQAGIYMNNASNCVIKNTTIMNVSVMGNCSAIGIAVFNSSGNAISNGEITNCEQGILIASGSNNTIEGIIIRNNTIVGVCIDSGGINTEIHENCFIDNEPQAIDDGTDNSWTSNYWYPQPGGNYTVPGAAESEDSDPLDECPLIEEPA
ncbi:MAG: PEGA domain-containing protein [Halobacteriota archaeon]